MKEERINRYWSNFFGIKAIELEKSGLKVVPHKSLEGYNGAWIFKRENQIIISVQAKLIEQIVVKIRNRESKINSFFSSQFLDYLFGNRIEKIIGPVYQGYYDNNKLNRNKSKDVKVINFEKDYKLIERLSKTGEKDEWLYSGINKETDKVYGYFYKNKIESIGHYKLIEKDVAFIGVYTNPKFRGLGFSQSVLRTMMVDLSKLDKLIRYQTLRSNGASIRVAQKNGFEEYANNIAIRLKNEQD